MAGESLDTNPQIAADFSKTTRTALIVWGIVAAVGLIWSAFTVQHEDAGFFTVVVFLVVLPVLALSSYSYHLYLRALEKAKKNAAEMGELFDSTLSTLALAIDAKDK